MDSAFSLPRTVSLLSATPDSLDALLRRLPESWTERNEGDGTWTVRGVVGHLIHGERTDWIPRMRMILAHGEARTFEPFDRQAQDRENPLKTLPELLDEFGKLRRENLETLRLLNPGEQDLARRGRHPAFGVVTLSQLLATWAAHDLSHLHQIARIMAHQYRDSVGPWIEYLGVLHCGGRSGPA